MADYGAYILEKALEYFFDHCPDCRAQACFDDETDEAWEQACDDASEALKGLWDDIPAL